MPARIYSHLNGLSFLCWKQEMLSVPAKIRRTTRLQLAKKFDAENLLVLAERPISSLSLEAHCLLVDISHSLSPSFELVRAQSLFGDSST